MLRAVSIATTLVSPTTPCLAAPSVAQFPFGVRELEVQRRILRRGEPPSLTWKPFGAKAFRTMTARRTGVSGTASGRD
jgi:hypothetical protein